MTDPAFSKAAKAAQASTGARGVVMLYVLRNGMGWATAAGPDLSAEGAAFLEVLAASAGYALPGIPAPLSRIHPAENLEEAIRRLEAIRDSQAEGSGNRTALNLVLGLLDAMDRDPPSA